MTKEAEPKISANLTPDRIKSVLIRAYEASDLIETIMTADVPVMSPVIDRYRNMLRNAQNRFSGAVIELSGDTELLQISDAIHGVRCGCTPGAPKDGCDWSVADTTSSQRTRLLLQAAEFKFAGGNVEDVTSGGPEVQAFLDYFDLSKDERMARSKAAQA